MRTPPGHPLVFENVWNRSHSEGRVFASIRVFYCPEAQRTIIETEAWIEGSKKAETHAFLDPTAMKAGAKSDVATRVLRDATRVQVEDISRDVWQAWCEKIRKAVAPKIVPAPQASASEKTG